MNEFKSTGRREDVIKAGWTPIETQGYFYKVIDQTLYCVPIQGIEGGADIDEDGELNCGPVILFPTRADYDFLRDKFGPFDNPVNLDSE